MKASKKILLIAAGLVITGVIIGLVMLRNHASLWLNKIQAESNYREVAVGEFESLNFSDNWIVDIRQGNEYKVELALDSTAQKPVLEIINGTLYFKADTTGGASKNIQAKIEVQSLMAIKAMAGTKIHLRDFQADTITLILENASSFTSYNSNFKFMSLKTSGNVSLQLIEDQDF